MYIAQINCLLTEISSYAPSCSLFISSRHLFDLWTYTYIAIVYTSEYFINKIVDVGDRMNGFVLQIRLNK